MSSVSSPSQGIFAKGAFTQVQCSPEDAEKLSLPKLLKGVFSVAGTESEAPAGDSFVSIAKNQDKSTSKNAVKAGKEAGIIGKFLEGCKLYLKIKYEIFKHEFNTMLSKASESLDMDFSFLKLTSIQEKLDRLISQQIEMQVDQALNQSEATN